MASAPASDSASAAPRLDKWLWAVRIFSTRALATDACRAGSVAVAGLPAKPARVVRVGSAGPGWIKLERIHEVRPTREAARSFGAALAVTHGAGASAYGAPPDGWDGPLTIVTDARRREQYWTTYSGVDELGLPVRLDGPGLSKPDDLPHPEVPRFVAEVVPAGRLGMIAEIRYANGRPFDADEPLYLRSPDVTLSAGPKRVSA